MFDVGSCTDKCSPQTCHCSRVGSAQKAMDEDAEHQKAQTAFDALVAIQTDAAQPTEVALAANCIGRDGSLQPVNSDKL